MAQPRRSSLAPNKGCIRLSQENDAGNEGYAIDSSMEYSMQEAANSQIPLTDMKRRRRSEATRRVSFAPGIAAQNSSPASTASPAQNRSKALPRNGSNVVRESRSLPGTPLHHNNENHVPSNLDGNATALRNIKASKTASPATRRSGANADNQKRQPLSLKGKELLRTPVKGISQPIAGAHTSDLHVQHESFVTESDAMVDMDMDVDEDSTEMGRFIEFGDVDRRFSTAYMVPKYESPEPASKVNEEEETDELKMNDTLHQIDMDQMTMEFTAPLGKIISQSAGEGATTIFGDLPSAPSSPEKSARKETIAQAQIRSSASSTPSRTRAQTKAVHQADSPQILEEQSARPPEQNDESINTTTTLTAAAAEPSENVNETDEENATDSAASILTEILQNLGITFMDNLQIQPVTRAEEPNVELPLATFEDLIRANTSTRIDYELLNFGHRELSEFIAHGSKVIVLVQQNIVADPPTVLTDALDDERWKSILDLTAKESRLFAQREWYVWSTKINRARLDTVNEAIEMLQDDISRLAAKEESVTHESAVLQAHELQLRNVVYPLRERKRVLNLQDPARMSELLREQEQIRLDVEEARTRIASVQKQIEVSTEANNLLHSEILMIEESVAEYEDSFQRSNSSSLADYLAAEELYRLNELICGVSIKIANGNQIEYEQVANTPEGACKVKKSLGIAT